MIRRKHLLRSFSLALVLCPVLLNAQSIVVDAATEYQVIDGFGGMNHTSWVSDFNTDQRAKIFNNAPGNMGLSILRVHVDPNASRFNEQVPTAQYATGQGAKVLASPWDPPSSLLDFSGDDPHLPYENYGAYADHLESFNTLMNANGVPLYAISVQNEPDIGEWTSWSATEIYTFVRDFGDKISTRVMAAESFNFKHSYTDQILNDATASVNLDIVGGHIYGNGLYDYPLAREKGKPIWMTEHLTGSDAHYLNNWNLAMEMGKEINDCMEANFNAYLWWYIRRFYSLIRENGNISEKGYVISHFSKFVRPGAVRVGAKVSDASGVYATAFKTDTSMCIVAVNSSYSSVNIAIDIQNSDDSDFVKFTSNGKEYLVNKGTLSATGGTFSVSLEARSISTLTTSPSAGAKYNNIAPVADAGDDRTIILDEDQTSISLSLDASASTDPDGQIANYSWSRGGAQLAWTVSHDLTLSAGKYVYVLTLTDDDGARDFDTISITVKTLYNTDLWFEAECNTVGSNWVIQDHGTASNGRYVFTPSGTQLTGGASEHPDDQIRIDFTLSEAANYKVWGRVITPNADDDSFWVKMDDSEWVLWNSIPSGSNWHWDDLHDGDNSSPMVYNLSAGDHTLLICYREDGALLDKLLISNTGITPLGLGGDAEGCVIIDPSTEIWLEAECAEVGESWEKDNDINASNQAFAGTPAGSDKLNAPSEHADDWISFPFTISQATEYLVWGRVITPSGDDDSFWVRMDDSDWILWEDIPIGSGWHWDDVHANDNSGPVVYELTEGEHTLYICFREGGPLLDKILIANTGQTPVGNGGSAEACIVGLNPVRADRDVQVYPNPSVGQFHVVWGQSFSRLDIISLEGKVLLSRSYSKPRNSEELITELAPGLYILRISNNNTQRISRLGIQDD